MTVNKLERFAQIAAFDHVLEYTDFQKKGVAKPKGRWKQDVFGNDNPITLELACGTGAYTLELARRHPTRNFIGVDIKGARIWKGAKKALDENLENVRFIRMFIDHLDEYFAKDEVDEIWITFADPYPRAGDRNKRLTSLKFLKQYQHILSDGGVVHFKTDNIDFFDYSCRSVDQFGGVTEQRIDDIYDQKPDHPLLTIQTQYEKKHLKNKKSISYARFQLV